MVAPLISGQISIGGRDIETIAPSVLRQGVPSILQMPLAMCGLQALLAVRAGDDPTRCVDVLRNCEIQSGPNQSIHGAALPIAFVRSCF